MPTLECPICRRIWTFASPAEAPYRPFCCRRCKLVDLGRWLSEEYRIREEAPDLHPDEAEARPPPPDGDPE